MTWQIALVFVLLAGTLASFVRERIPPDLTALALLVVLIATLLAVVHMPLPWGNGPAPDLPPLYLVGIWIALVLTLVFSGTYAFRVAEEARLLAGALSAPMAQLAFLLQARLYEFAGLLEALRTSREDGGDAAASAVTQ